MGARSSFCAWIGSRSTFADCVRTARSPAITRFIGPDGKVAQCGQPGRCALPCHGVPESAGRVREEFAPDVIDVIPDGRLSVTVCCQLNERMLHHLFSYGVQLEVLEPAWVRNWMDDQARAMLERGR
ncbi:MAG: WYL domain-containing protein [Eggerthellaceae bacterium]